MWNASSIFIFLVFLTPVFAQLKHHTMPKVVRYDLYVRDTTVTFGGTSPGKKPRRAIAVNGQIPMPTLTFAEGDTAEIYVHNELSEETSLHWHGLFLPNQYDGVPNLTQMPIKPHTTHLYRFPIIQNGTHWYHSHTGLQEQIGMYGSMILNKRSTDSTFRTGIDDMMNGMMKMNGNLDDMGMSMSLNQMDMNTVMYPEASSGAKDIVTLNYAMLKSPTKTTLPTVPSLRVKELFFELSGNMNRYVWSIDNKVVSETDKILIKKDEIVRITIHNGSMMRHPMHLHGHDFRVLNGQGDYSPLKNVIDIMPMETDTLEFAATESGDWFFHCHILYHMMAGMGRVFSYENSPPNPEIPNPKLAQRKLFADDRAFHTMAENDFATNGNDGELMVSNTRWSIGTEWRLGYHDRHGYETETHIGRYIGKMQWLMPFIGFDWRYRKLGIDEQEKNIFGQRNTKDNRAVLSLGVNYTLPMLITAQAEVFTDGIVRFQLERKDIPLSKRLRMSWMVNTDKEYMAGFQYIVGKNLGFSTHYDSDMGFGVGLMIKY
ncbi:MAG: hypothetical protein EAZ32_05345 [Cytophagia bacterium]|nr:MAG: hypothetical protein EAZ46_03350 [Runella sp.]TAG21513.1 MAG: hypothetical protein EAZ38_07925 [Cytophagales bacterium]TAG40800.1 MAG: hypothetical protein EAZ32_05345 [Cytophagia bacterium]TAG82277.1 MAG: hypothetical protein EAZ22_05520 [Cytophagales bacterium]